MRCGPQKWRDAFHLRAPRAAIPGAIRKNERSREEWETRGLLRKSLYFLTCHEMTVWSGLEVGRNTPDLARLRN